MLYKEKGQTDGGRRSINHNYNYTSLKIQVASYLFTYLPTYSYFPTTLLRDQYTNKHL